MTDVILSKGDFKISTDLAEKINLAAKKAKEKRENIVEIIERIELITLHFEYDEIKTLLAKYLDVKESDYYFVDIYRNSLNSILQIGYIVIPEVNIGSFNVEILLIPMRLFHEILENNPSYKEYKDCTIDKIEQGLEKKSINVKIRKSKL
jgi:hypothetical protein